MQINPGTTYASLWTRFRQSVQDYQGTCAAVVAEEAVAFSLEEEFMRAFDARARPLRTILQETAERIARSLRRMAQERFAPPGGHLKIDEPTVDAESFDPQALWVEFEHTYGGARGQEVGYRQAATDLVRAFGLHSGTAVARKAGYVPLSIKVYVDRRGKEWGCTRLDPESGQDVQTLLRALGAFARWGGTDHLAARLSSYGLSLEHHRHRFEPRNRIPLGPDLAVVTYLTRFECQFSPPLAERLQVFLGVYRSDTSLAP